MAGKNQPPDRGRVVIVVPRAVAVKVRKQKQRRREETTRRVDIPRR